MTDKQAQINYRQGFHDFGETLIKTLEIMDQSGMIKHTTAEVIGFIKQAQELSRHSIKEEDA